MEKAPQESKATSLEARASQPARPSVFIHQGYSAAAALPVPRTTAALSRHASLLFQRGASGVQPPSHLEEGLPRPAPTKQAAALQSSHTPGAVAAAAAGNSARRQSEQNRISLREGAAAAAERPRPWSSFPEQELQICAGPKGGSISSSLQLLS